MLCSKNWQSMVYEAGTCCKTGTILENTPVRHTEQSTALIHPTSAWYGPQHTLCPGIGCTPLKATHQGAQEPTASPERCCRDTG
eukprot:5903943-Ditylum_brightwellii.AAC.1